MRIPFTRKKTDPLALAFDPQRKFAPSEVPNFVQHAIFSTTPADYQSILKLTERFVALCASHKIGVMSSMSVGLDLCIVNARTPLNFDAMLLTSDEDFSYDMVGIARNVDRLTGELQNGFKPINLRRAS